MDIGLNYIIEQGSNFLHLLKESDDKGNIFLGDI